jgi:hypothetical protein
MIVMPPSVKSIVPVAAGFDAIDGTTVAVNVTDDVAATGFTFAAITTVAVAGAMVMIATLDGDGANVPSPPYVATTGCAPTGNVDTVVDAYPPDTAAAPSTVDPSVKDTLPPAWCEPETDGPTNAVRYNGAPISADADESCVVVVNRTADDSDAAMRLLPTYDAFAATLPAASAVVVSFATPLERVAMPNESPCDANFTLPGGTSVLGSCAETIAVNVTD